MPVAWLLVHQGQHYCHRSGMSKKITASDQAAKSWHSNNTVNISLNLCAKIITA